MRRASRSARHSQGPFLLQHIESALRELRFSGHKVQSRCSFRWMSAASPRASGLLRDGHVPGTVQFGDAPVDDAAADLPQLLLNKPAIGDETEGAEPAMLEVCSGRSQTTALAVATASAGPGCCRRNDELMFGAISVPVAAPGAVHGDDALGQACSAAYRAMLDCLQAARFSCLLRIWNSTPDINVDSSGLERYRRFKLQRFRAVWEARLPTHIGAPAAPALSCVSVSSLPSAMSSAVRTAVSDSFCNAAPSAARSMQRPAAAARTSGAGSAARSCASSAESGASRAAPRTRCAGSACSCRAERNSRCVIIGNSVRQAAL